MTETPATLTFDMHEKDLVGIIVVRATETGGNIDLHFGRSEEVPQEAKVWLYAMTQEMVGGDEPEEIELADTEE